MIQLNAEEYAKRVEQALLMPGPLLDDHQWNRSYQVALHTLGLWLMVPDEFDKHVKNRLMSFLTLNEEYPDGKPCKAPNFKNTEFAPPWSKDSLVVWRPIRSDRRKIVCAATRGVDGFVIPSIRHYDLLMNHHIDSSEAYRENYRNRCDPNQGFFDNYGIYLDREEAFEVALTACQISKVNQMLFSDNMKARELFSEMLY